MGTALRASQGFRLLFALLQISLPLTASGVDSFLAAGGVKVRPARAHPT